MCSNHVAPFTAFANAYFVRDHIAVWKASRGFGGKTVLLALLVLTEAITMGASINLLGGSGEQSQNVQGYLGGTHSRTRGKFFDAPLAPKSMIVGSYKRELRLNNGALVKALMASPQSVRGPHPQRLRLDEIDEMDVDIFDSAMGQPMSANGIQAHTVCSSTHQHVDGTMTEALTRAKSAGWGTYVWCYRENLVSNGGWLDDQEVEDKKQAVPTQMWLAEYEGQEPNPEGRVFSDEVLEQLFRPELGRFEGLPGEQIEVTSPGQGDFYHGADWAKARDWTVLHTMQERSSGPNRLAAWSRHGREAWPKMIGYYNERVINYGGKAIHDITGIGSVVHDYLTIASDGFNFSSVKERSDMLSKYVAACESGDMEYPMIKYLYEEHKYLTVDMLLGGSNSKQHLPDSVAAAAMAHRAAKSKSGGLLLGRI